MRERGMNERKKEIVRNKVSESERKGERERRH
jgi:hypothetical protein